MEAVMMSMCQSEIAKQRGRELLGARYESAQRQHTSVGFVNLQAVLVYSNR